MENQDPTAIQAVVAAQESLAEEVVSNNGIKKTIHVVVKNSPFSITLALTKNNRPFYGNLKNMRIDIDARLVYDLEVEKEVTLVKDKPMDAKMEFGRGIVNCEFKIKVLTTQHEGMFFRIKLEAVDETDDSIFISYSSPIKVISKSDLVKKKATDVKQKTQKQRPSKSGRLIQMLQRIEQRARDNMDIMNTLLVAEPTRLQGSREQEEGGCWGQSQRPRLEAALGTFLEAFGALEPQDRATHVRSALAAHDPAAIYELMDLIWTEGLQYHEPHGHVHPGVLPSLGALSSPYFHHFESMVHAQDAVHDVAPYLAIDDDPRHQ